MESLKLALEVLDRVDAAEGQERSLDAGREARRLLRGHPDSDVSEQELAEVIREEVEAGRSRGDIW